MSLLLSCLVTSLLPSFVMEDSPDLNKLAGEWTVVSVERDGSSIPNLFVGKLQRITKGNETTVMRNGELYLKSKFKLNAGTNPKHIDFDVTAGDDKGKTMLGIYDVNGDTLKLCYGPAEKGRPTGFSTKSGTGQTYSVWKKKK